MAFLNRVFAQREGLNAEKRTRRVNYASACLLRDAITRAVTNVKKQQPKNSLEIQGVGETRNFYPLELYRHLWSFEPDKVAYEMTEARKLKSLKLQLSAVKQSIDAIVAFAENANQNHVEVAVRRDNLKKLYARFITIQDELLPLDEENGEQHFAYRQVVEDAFYKAEGILSCACVNDEKKIVPASKVKLPDIKLPTFDGKPKDWTNFHSIFASMIHGAPQYTGIQKLYYLRTSLSGPALQLIQSVPITEENYEVAWQLLLCHYNEPKKIKQFYVESLFENAALKKESASDLRKVVESFEANVSALKHLGEPTAQWDTLLIHMLSHQLDATTLRSWKEYATEKSVETFKDLVAFIYRRVSVLEDLPTTTVMKPTKHRVLTTQTTTSKDCAFCSLQHPLYTCSEFFKLSLQDKEKFVIGCKLCLNCLRPGHRARECKSTSTCKKCRKRHHTQLCSSLLQQCDSPALKEHTDPPTTSAKSSVAESITCASSGQRKHTLLATATVILVDDDGKEHFARALLDSGSDTCFITENLAQQLKSRKEKTNLKISGISSTTTTTKYCIRATLHSRIGRYFADLQFFVLPKITENIPSSSIDTSGWNLPSNIFLADPHYDSSNKIDLLIGAEVFFEIMKPPGRIHLGKDLPTLVNSELGWIVTGPVVSTLMSSFKSIVVHHATTSVNEVHKLMEQFWTIEEGNTTSLMSSEQAACEEHFRNTVSRTSLGRYIVRLPLKTQTLDKLVNNRKTAVRRFHLLQTRLNNNEDLRKRYSSFIDEYNELGHMKRITEKEYDDNTKHLYYLPHHAVTREESTTTKLRVVFDASCKTRSGVSLNDALMVGPTIQDDIRTIIMRARKHPIMITADIKMMYRQILVDDRDASLQLIIWKSSPSDPLHTYKLCTVTYGTASAPFLATRVLSQLADDEGIEYPQAAQVLKRDFYVDDLVTGSSNVKEAIDIIHQLSKLVEKGGFTLRKWATNNEEVRQSISQNNLANEESFCFDRDHVIKTLGLRWHPLTDTMTYGIHSQNEMQPITKRSALSNIARLFDPIGLVGPVVTKAKVFMQSLWTLKANDGSCWEWDTELPEEYKQKWLAFQHDLPQLNSLQIDRCVLLQDPTSIQLHIFADASQVAYGACAYLRSTNRNGTIKIALVSARSRVAPLKSLSIPRLELCSALLASDLLKSVQHAMQLDVECYCWLDSTVALYWIQASPSKWNTFVGNRVTKIQQATSGCIWSHVKGLENPADHISRGLSSTELVNCDLWWHGPPWLQLQQHQWPQSQLSSELPPEASVESRSTILATPASLHANVEQIEFMNRLISKFSDYRKLIRVLAHCIRFVQNLRTSTNTSILSADEVMNAECRLIHVVQTEIFEREWNQLSQNLPVSTKSRLKWFHPFVSSDNLIRIGGRISRSNQPYDVKHQILLTASHPLSVLLVRHLHEKHLHAAPQLLLTILRQRYWLIGARSLAKRICHECVTCCRARPRLLEQFMAELPRTRVNPSRPFSIVGVDYWGPISLAPIHRRAAPGRAFVAVFICFATKAVHLELVLDLTTAKFIQAFRRFVARRGLCHEVYSDNGRNFIGASRELRALVTGKQHRVSVLQECSSQGIRWHFNPPKASHFGGLWESAINSAQKHFVRTLGKTTLPQDDMETLLCQIECCLNSRPLIPLSDDPSDLEPLTPGHFLVAGNLKAVPDKNYEEISMNRLKRYHIVQKLLQQIWRRWSAEYLSILQPRSKWLKAPVNIEIGQLVLVKDESTGPLHWPLGRIIKLHPGNDGLTRVVTLKTASGDYIRPVAKLCLLPVPTMDQNVGSEGPGCSRNAKV